MRKSPILVTAGFIAVILLTSCEPAPGPPPPIGPGCQFSPNSTVRRAASAANSEVNYAAFVGMYIWNETTTDAPLLGGGPTTEFGIYSYTNAQSVNSGYTSTGGPAADFAMPTCGSSSWASRPNVWLNSTKVSQRLAIGDPYANYATAAHELGHVLGLYENKNGPCAQVTIMEWSHQHGYGDCGVYSPRSGDISTINSLYN